MPEFMRHDLVWVDENLPFVVTRQYGQNNQYLNVARCLSPDKSPISRTALQIDIHSIIRHELPLSFSVLLDNKLVEPESAKLITIFSQLDSTKLSAIKLINQNMADSGLDIRVFGSCSWQYFTRQQFINADSDLDVLVYISDIKQLDELAPQLESLEQLLQRKVDGEIVIANQYFVAWREWHVAAAEVLVKTNHDVFCMTKRELLQKCQR